ncbi:hypothetical protein SH449x_000977 [Pirellulaceae bacterium SH449]
MNRKVRRALLVGTVVLGMSTLIPYEASAQFFRGRGSRGYSTGGNSAGGQYCPSVQVCCTPSYNQSSVYGQTGVGNGSTSYTTGQSTNCCGATLTSSANNDSGMNQQGGQQARRSYDSEGNRTEPNTQWNNQQGFDSLGNRIDTGTQWNNQQRFDSRGDRIESGIQWNRQRFDSQGNRVDAGIQSNQSGARIDGNLNRSQGGLDSQGSRIDAGIQSTQDRPQLDTNLNPTSGAQGSADVGVTNPISPKL